MDRQPGDVVVLFRKLWRRLEFDRREDLANRRFTIDRVIDGSTLLDGVTKYVGRFMATWYSNEDIGIIEEKMIAKGDTKKLAKILKEDL